MNNLTWSDETGTVAGSIKVLVNYLATSDDVRTVILDNTKVGAESFYVELKPPVPWFTETPGDGRCQITRIGVGLETLTEDEPLSTSSAISEEVVTTLASAALRNGTFEVVIDESPNSRAQLEAKIVPKEA